MAKTATVSVRLEAALLTALRRACRIEEEVPLLTHRFLIARREPHTAGISARFTGPATRVY